MDDDDATVADGIDVGWRLETTLTGHDGRIEALKPVEGRLMSASSDGHIRVWGGPNGTAAEGELSCHQTIKAHDDAITALALWPAASQLTAISGSLDGTLRLWNTDTWDCEAVLRADAKATVFKPPVHINTGEMQAADTGEPAARVRCAIVTPDGLALAGCLDSSIWVWDLSTRACLARLCGHLRPVTALAVGDDVVYSGSTDTTVRRWACSRGEKGLKWQCEAVLAVGEGAEEPVLSLCLVRHKAAAPPRVSRECLLVGSKGVVKVVETRCAAGWLHAV